MGNYYKFIPKDPCVLQNTIKTESVEVATKLLSIRDLNLKLLSKIQNYDFEVSDLDIFVAGNKPRDTYQNIYLFGLCMNKKLLDSFCQSKSPRFAYHQVSFTYRNISYNDCYHIIFRENSDHLIDFKKSMWRIQEKGITNVKSINGLNEYYDILGKEDTYLLAQDIKLIDEAKIFDVLIFSFTTSYYCSENFKNRMEKYFRFFAAIIEEI